MADLVHQVKAASALIMLLSVEDLPISQWIVYAELGLEGWIVNMRDDGTDDLDALQMYAQKFGTQVRIDHGSHVGYVAGTYSGTPVRIMGKVRDHA